MIKNIQKIEDFKKIIWRYYKENKRDLPWRSTTNPYRIIVSEVMLQQTQVSRVLTKYTEWLKVFPDFESLASASLHEVLSVWSGMGYNRRAKYLREIAKIVVKDYKGKLPSDIDTIDALPGIGYATACSVICFSFNIPTVFIETNIRRVFIHFFFKDQTGIDDKDILDLVSACVDSKDPREWYYALMDYGAMLGRLKNNPNRRSRHYVKQSTFIGSRRQIRGEILRHLVQHGVIKNDAFPKSILIEMEKEGFIKAKGGDYYAES